jgi:hypothetical protein
MRDSGCWLTWSDDTENDIVSSLLQSPQDYQLELPPSIDLSAPHLFIQNIMGTPSDLLLNSSSTITSALINGLSQKCKVYDLKYLRCQDLEFEISGLLG